MESITTMPKESKREVRKRLKLDLEQIMDISTKLEALEQQSRSSGALGTPGTVGSSGGGGGGVGGVGGNKEKRTPKANQMYSNSDYFSAKDKMPPPEKVKPKTLVPAKKGGGAGAKNDLDSKRLKVETARAKRMGEIMKQCGTLLKKLFTHKHAWVFNEPVDAVKLGLHDYHKVIRRPMDLGTIKKKLEGGHYRSPLDFADDVKLTFANAMTYNPPGHDVFIMADILRQLFEERWRNIKEKLEEEQTKCRVEDEVFAEITQGNHHHNPALQNLKQSLMSIEDQLSSLKKPAAAAAARGSKKSGRRQMTYEEKTELGKNLEKVLEQSPGDKADEIVSLLKKHNPNLSQSEDTIEVDIDGIDNDMLWELHKLVASGMKPRNKKRPRQAAAEGAKQAAAPGESPKKSRKSGEGMDEDVDIDGEDDMPTANYSPVVVDKDTNEGRESSGGSSSSSSGSSSSESDSGSSSHSDSDAEGPRTAGIEKPTSQKEPVGVREQLSSPSDKIDGAKKPVTSPGDGGDAPESQAEKSTEKCQSAERPVSPEKSVRAALLKGRFADTILKAREKTLPLKSGDNLDPEKLRREREELEKKLREDKARLQADAKAAEVARKKAEAEAATEARKKREVEREAARRALQQMERTVDLDAHCEILKDFDLMRTSSKEPFQTSAGEVSPPNSPDGCLPGFALSQGNGNALEQLGLFMKLDEDEDEKQGDGEVAYADENGEVEEGEID